MCVVLLAGCAQEQTENSETAGSGDPQQWISLLGDPDKPHIVFVSGDEEYRSEEALPMLARVMNTHHGFNCTVLFSQDPEKPGIVDPNYHHNIPGLEHLKDADLMVLFTRFRALPDEQMAHIDRYLRAGRPVVGIRTATHAFNFNSKDSTRQTSYAHYGNYYNEDDAWNGGFGRVVMGEKWIRHHGHHGHQSTRGVMAPGAEGHAILNGISPGQIWGPTDVYGVRLPIPGAQPIVLGQSVDRTMEMDEDDPRLGMRPDDQQLPGTVTRKIDGKEVEIDLNDPMPPVTWIRNYQLPDGVEGKNFSTTIGASVDLLEEGTRRLLVNGMFWSLDMDVPEKANVSFVGTYNPTRFAFKDDKYWEEKNVVIADIIDNSINSR